MMQLLYWVKLRAIKIVFFILLFILSLNLFCYKETENIVGSKDFNIQGLELSLHSKQVLEKNKKLGRAILECYTVLAISQTNYWINYSDWIEDWQFRLRWEDQKMRLFTLDANRFDDNGFVTNWTHSLSGAIYYSFPRSNEHTWLESFIFTSVASLYWEYLVEWREVVSVNDNIFTSFGGPSIGETLFQLSNYFSKESGTINKILTFAFNPILYFNNWLDRKKKKNSIVDYKVLWHEFYFFLGQKKGFELEKDNNYTHLNIGLETEIINVPEFEEPGNFSRFIKDVYSSELFFDINFSSTGVKEYNALTKVALFGHFKHDIGKKSLNGLKGSNLFFGAATGFELFKEIPFSSDDSDKTEKKSSPVNFSDKLAVMNLFGPFFSCSIFSGNFKLRLRADAYVNFALINSFAMNKYSSQYDMSGVKSTLKNHGYYYALGLTISSDFTLSYRDFKFRGKIKYYCFNSIEGMDRHQIDVIDDFDINDSRLISGFSFGFKLPSAPLTFELSLEGINRKGNIKNIYYKEFETRLYSRIKFSF